MVLPKLVWSIVRTFVAVELEGFNLINVIYFIVEAKKRVEYTGKADLFKTDYDGKHTPEM